MKSRKQLPALFAAILLVIVLLPAGYMGAYYVTVQRNLEGASGFTVTPVPSYRYGGETFFWPAFAVDRRIRQDYWQPRIVPP